MTDFKAELLKLHKNLNALRERKAKYGANAPPELLNWIDDHRAALSLTEQAERGDLSEARWREALKPLRVSLDRDALEARRAKLEQTLTNLADLVEQGLAVAEAQAPVQEQLAAIERQLALLQNSASPSPTFDQQKQQVDNQINIAHLYQVYQAAPGRAELSGPEFQKILADYLGWVRREYGATRLHGLQTLQDSGPLDQPLARVYTSLASRHRPAVLPGGEPGDARRRLRPEAGQMAPDPEPRPVDMADLLTLGERVAIVGGAGSGKTTYLSFVAAGLVQAAEVVRKFL